MFWFKHKVIHQKIKDVFFDSRKRIVNLKNDPRWLIDISPRHIKLIFLHDYALICYGLILIFSVITIFSSHKTKAQNAVFYPTSCLGGWTNTDKASGPADLNSDGENTAFNSSNSAILKDSSGEIYCGNFTGDIPKDTEPKKFYLSFSWSIDDGSIIHPEPQPFTPINTDNQSPVPATTNQNTDSSSATTPSDTKTDSPIPLPANSSTDSLSPTVPPPTPTDTKIDSSIPLPENSPQSFLFNYLSNNIAYAQSPMLPNEEIPTPSSSVPTVPAPADTSAVSPGAESSATLVIPVSGALNDITNLLDKTKAEIIPTENKPQNFLFISYTLDGATWSPLGEVNSSDWKGVRFAIPLSSWDDVSKMQVSIKAIQTIDKIPAVYLDAMRVEVEYESIVGIVTPSSYHLTSMTSNTEGFSLSLGGHPPEREDVLVSNTVNPISGLAVYDTESGVLRLNTYVNGPSYYLDAEYFGVGDFTVITTNDESICEGLTLKDCLSSSSFAGSGTFSIAPK